VPTEYYKQDNLFRKKRMIFKSGKLVGLQLYLSVCDVTVDSFYQLIHTGKIFLRPEIPQHHNLERLPVEIAVELVHDVGLHRLLRIVVERIPSDTHHHLVDAPVVDVGEPEIYSGLHLVRQLIDNIDVVIRRRYSQFLGPSAEALDDFAFGEVR
jgi:hypothetical protein